MLRVLLLFSWNLGLGPGKEEPLANSQIVLCVHATSEVVELMGLPLATSQQQS